ncbi:ferritin-like domain-containing protein [Polynucleobacter sp. MWH-Svant-W18]|uniref:ferritin-like domain-containing protein n=1 Tax=Polynucleobacter sp. MWH-Svant-W18 TaxID=1855909 RepID=UPI001BFCFAA1|nr:ferritin-like domain-containing protein [Polynucleobacter sp. MWH-Svant-W18]QWD78494.1 ferritin-like domain-containing protein [Polynucleobacter sp. MWH-Svant-W18]
MPELRQTALELLAVIDPARKVAGVQELFADYHQQKIELNTTEVFNAQGLELPGRPVKPQLIPPLEVPKRSMATPEGRVSLLHSLAHIEFNAMNLALDAIWRFPEMPAQYYADWLKVTKEEAYHFSLIEGHLQSLGFAYGDFPAHNSLWEMVERTSDAIIARMALVPRTMEARGLDAVPAIRDRFKQIKDIQVVEILEIILRDEVGHVLIGNQWFNFLCAKENISPIQAYRELARAYRAPTMRGPFNLEARKRAGFTQEELSLLGT